MTDGTCTEPDKWAVMSPLHQSKVCRCTEDSGLPGRQPQKPQEPQKMTTGSKDMPGLHTLPSGIRDVEAEAMVCRSAEAVT